MFVTADFLATEYGVHNDIAIFFVDKQPPQANLYWHNKLLYVPNNPGYLIIPVFTDALSRLKFSKEILLNNNFVQLFEQIAHIAALEEIKKVSYQEAVEQCILFVKDKIHNQFFYNNLLNFIEGKRDNFIHQYSMPFAALHRGDLFLFALVIFDFDEETAVKIIKHWFAIIGSFLLLDDAEDIEQDLAAGEKNAFIEAGLNEAGIENIKLFAKNNIEHLRTFNRTLGRTIDSMLSAHFTSNEVLKFIN